MEPSQRLHDRCRICLQVYCVDASLNKCKYRFEFMDDRSPICRASDREQHLRGSHEMTGFYNA